MKRIVFVIVLIVIIVTSILFLNPAFTPVNIAKLYFDTPYKPLAGSKEELYQDIFVTLLNPYIENAVKDYYGEPYNFDPWDVNILNIERPYGDRTPQFVIKLQIKPYVGAHNTIGIDNVTITVLPGGSTKVDKFEHIKSFEIPPGLR